MIRSRGGERVGGGRAGEGLRWSAFALAGLAGLGVADELRHRRALAADPLRAVLSVPLTGEPVEVTSADGTRIAVELFGPVGVAAGVAAGASVGVAAGAAVGSSTGAPTVVLVPGWTEKLQVFELVTRGLLDRGFRVVGYDLRGQGGSGMPVDGDQRIERYGEDLEAVLEAVSDGRSDVLVAGHSMGGMSIMAWAGAFPLAVSVRVRGAALINTGALGLVLSSTLLPAVVPVRVRREVGTRVVLGAAPLMQISTPLSRAALRYAAFGPSASAAQVDFLERMLWSCPVSVRGGAGATLAGLDVLAGAARIDVPTVVIAGDRDRLTPPALSQQLVETVPQLAEMVLLERTGHMSILERPDAVVEAICGLARGVGLMPVGLRSGS